MTATIWGPFTDETGIAHYDDGSFHAEPAANYNRTQPAHVPVDIDHDDGHIGQVVYLEHAHGKLHAVAVVELDTDELDTASGRNPDDRWDTGDIYWSSTSAGTASRSRSHERENLELRSITLTTSPAGHGLNPLRWLPGDIRHGAERRWPREWVPDLVRRAVAHVKANRSPGPLTIALPLQTRSVPPVARAKCPGIIMPDGTIGELARRPGRILSVR